MGAQTLHERPKQPALPPPAANTHPLATEPVLPVGTSLQVEIARNYAMKTGEAVEGHLVFPLYVDGKLAVPAGTIVRGTVTGLQADAKTRWQGRLRGDLTPFHVPQVQFDAMELEGKQFKLHTSSISAGAPILHLAASGSASKGSLIGREWRNAKTQMHDQLAFFTAPGFGDRALQMLYRQLPYHPERIPAHTAWTFELAQPLDLPEDAERAQPAPAQAPVSGKPEMWSVRALLTHDLTSATAKPGDPVQALVVEPVFDHDHQLVVPQGSVLVGKVTTAKSARSLGRNGKLRFVFQQVKFPEGAGLPEKDRSVEGGLAGATTASAQGLAMDAEGTVTPKSRSSAVAPLLLTLLAGRALDQDGNLTAQTGVSSNGFGLVGRIVGMTAGNRNLAAGLGFYAAALSAYDNFLRPGHDVVFPKDTHIEIETTPLRAPVLAPQGLE